MRMFIRGFMSLLISIIVAWSVFYRYDEEMGIKAVEDNQEQKRQKYLPFIPGNLLPVFLVVLALGGIFLEGIENAAKFMLSVCFGIFFEVSIYIPVLLLFLQAFRKRISARACAILWVLPNYLYLACLSLMQISKPLFVIRTPGNFAWIIFVIWFAGFFSVLMWKTAEHLLFRRRVLRDSYAVSEQEILLLWNTIVEDARIKKPRFKLVFSPNIKTPLSIGLFSRAVRVVLPEKNYCAEDLEFIFRHEIIHVAREDSWAKFFLVFCTAMCWFHPLMWIAMKKCAEDLELSCDETVLLSADDESRKRYASLLLDTAGDERGFTTCLSASAKAMRYRLKNIVKPSKRHSGILVVGIMTFLLFMSVDCVALAYGGRSGAELIYGNGDYREYHLRSVIVKRDYDYRSYQVTDEAAFHEYLSGLTLSEFTGNYLFSDLDTEFSCMMDTTNGILEVVLCDNVLKIVPLGEKVEVSCYYIADGIDWDYLNGIIVGR